MFPTSQRHHPRQHLPHAIFHCRGRASIWGLKGARKFPEAASTGKECERRLGDGVRGYSIATTSSHAMRYARACLQAKLGWRGSRLEGLEVPHPIRCLWGALHLFSISSSLLPAAYPTEQKAQGHTHIHARHVSSLPHLKLGVLSLDAKTTWTLVAAPSHLTLAGSQESGARSGSRTAPRGWTDVPEGGRLCQLSGRDAPLSPPGGTA